MTKYVKSIKFSTSGETYVIRDAEQKSRLDTLEPQVAEKADTTAVNTALAGKQNKLTAGANITIENDVISATGGSGGGAVDSVNGKTGTVVLEAADVHAATEAQGALADTAVQPDAIADMATKTELSAKQDKLTSANAGTNVTITEESGVVKINAAGGSGGASTFAELQGQPTDNANLAAALDAKISTGELKTINDTSLEGSGNIELLTSSDLDDYYTKTEVDNGFLSSNQAVADAGKALVIDTTGKVVPTAIGSSSKLPYQRRTFWTQKVDCHNPITNFTVHTLNDLDPINIYEDKCVLYLPDSYTPDGDPTKVILFCKQGASEITSSSDTIVDQCTFFLKLGYAILAVEGIPDGLCNEKKIGKRTVGNYIHAQSMTKAYEKVVELYNIDPKGCYAYGWSQGGHTLQNLLDNTSLPILCAAAQSPVVSVRYHQWDLGVTATHGGVQYTKDARLSVARLFDYPAVSNNTELLALSYDASKTNGWDPYTRNVDNPYTGFVQSGNLWYFPSGTTADDITMVKRMRCPFKAWVADNDTSLGSDVTKAFVKAIKNSGQVAEIKCYSTGAHSIPSAQTTIATFEEHGVTQNLKPLYLEMAQWFEKYGGYSTEEYSPTPGPTPDPDALPLTDYTLSVTAATAGKVSSMSTRISTGSPDTANGILVPSRMAITITGLKPTGYPTLRVDGLWATSSGPNPLASGSSTPWSEVVGTISNYDANNYLPLNADGSSDTVTVENNTDNDYYYFFAFAATNKTDAIQAANYDLHYSIDEIPEPEPSGTLPLYSNIMMSVTTTDGGQIFDTAQGQTGKRLSSGSSTVATGILVKNGESITLTGLQSSGHPTLKVDYLYCTSAGPAPYAGTISGVWNQVVGTGSNWVAANYFPLNTEGNNTVTVTNNTGSDYYYFFCFCGPTKAESVDSSWYNITYNIDQIPLTTLPTHQYALSVTSTGAGGVTSSSNNRLCSGSTTAAEGVLVKNGETITLYGLQSTGNPTLRVDAVWANSAGPNPLSTSGVWSETVGTLSNYVAADYFPLNADGSSNSVSITNNNGNDYYYFFAFAATDKTSNISVGNYTIQYTIS